MSPNWYYMKNILQKNLKLYLSFSLRNVERTRREAEKDNEEEREEREKEQQ